MSENHPMRGVDFETATRGSVTSGTPGSGWWRLYGPRVLVSLAVIAVLSGGAVYASWVSESAPNVVYTASLEEVEAESQGSLKVDINSAHVEELVELLEERPAMAEANIEYRRANGPFATV